MGIKEVAFLGVILDNKLSFLPHIKMLKEKCTKALDVIKVVANSKWVADSPSFSLSCPIYVRLRLYCVWIG